MFERILVAQKYAAEVLSTTLLGWRWTWSHAIACIGSLLSGIAGLNDLFQNLLGPPARSLLVTLLSAMSRGASVDLSSNAILIHLKVITRVSSISVRGFFGLSERRVTNVDSHPVACWGVGLLAMAHVNQHIVTITI